MPLHLNVSGTWKAPTVWINNAGTWKKCAVWLNVSGTWKQITSFISAYLPASIWGTTFTSTGPVMTLNSSGAYSCTGGGGSGTWLVSGTNSEFEARASSLTGDTAYATGTYNTWLPLSTTRTWGLTAGPIGSSRIIYFTLEIRMAASPNPVLATCSMTLENDRT